MKKYIRNEYGYLVPNQSHPDFNKESENDRYWREIHERTKQRRGWEDAGEPIGWVALKLEEQE